MMRQFFLIPYKIEELPSTEETNVMDNEVECDVVITGETEAKGPKQRNRSTFTTEIKMQLECSDYQLKNDCINLALKLLYQQHGQCNEWSGFECFECYL